MGKHGASSDASKQSLPRGCHINPRVSLAEFAENEQLRAFDVRFDDVRAPFPCNVLKAAKERDFYNIVTTEDVDPRLELWLHDFEDVLAMLIRYVREGRTVFEEEFWAAARVVVALQLARTEPFRKKVLDLAIAASPFVESIVSCFNAGLTNTELAETLSRNTAKLLDNPLAIPSVENVALWAQAMWIRAMLEDFWLHHSLKRRPYLLLPIIPWSGTTEHWVKRTTYGMRGTSLSLSSHIRSRLSMFSF